MTSYPFSHAPSVDEDQCSAMTVYQLSQTIVDFVPHFAGHHRSKWGARNFDREIEFPFVTRVDDRAIGCSVFGDVCGAHQEARDFFDRFLGRRETDANEIVSRQRLQPLDRQGKMRAAL